MNVIREIIYSLFKGLDQRNTRRAGGKMLKVGDKAPDFKVETQEGMSVKLQDFVGKTIIMWFFPKADTPG